MSVYHPPIAEHENVITAALRVIQATHYGRESDPHRDAEQEYSEEQLALAARALAQAVDRKAANEQPIGWRDTSIGPTVDQTKALADQYHDLLKTVIDNTVAGGKEQDPVYAGTHSVAVVSAWIAYRALRLLEKVDPERTHVLIAELDGAFDNGGAVHAAWSAAQRMGFDPDQWRDEVVDRHARVRAEYAERTA